ncbi:MAG: 4Fe-4S ferredoxin [Syntrophus sp. RIFOXYC2_FULL_54_9]|nr:MAG: 4Fe-4S ferredoxin [Syntrophus sp. GWC2_56_31]OHE26075.1 MAG: 4Fe-4S ferredoxin [Syntrophus sp. RIFOXYC2_FULL_54_9]HBB17456.1 4Fe-4S ferredoxin [Syntrophus sp. (in: bacteria)]
MKRQNVRKLTGFIALLLFPATIFYMSPYLSVIGSASGVITGSLIFFFILFLSALFLRRAYCGWACISTGVHDAGLFFIKKKVGMKSRIIKYFIWTPWFLAIVILLSINGIKKIDPLAATTYGLSVTDLHGYVILYFILGLIITLALTVGKRSFCHHVCWMAPFIIIGDKVGRLLNVPSLHLETNKEKCKSCGLCSVKCPMSLPVMEMVASGEMKNTDCILCGECADNCRRKVICYKFK